jgi:hypothetical protein
MTGPSDGDCRTCGKHHPWPDGTIPKHPFNDGSLNGTDVLTPRMAVQVREQPWPFDPVLRQALIDKGVLEPDDLTRAEAKIRAVTGEMNGTAG